MYQLLTILVSLSLLVSCGTESRPTDAPVQAPPAQPHRVAQTVSFPPEQLDRAGVFLGRPQLRAATGVLKLQGVVTVPPQGVISVSFPLGGYLKSTPLLAGMPVRKGQVLAQVEDLQLIQLQQDFLTAREKFLLATNEYNRQRELNLTKATSDKIYQQARTELEGQRILMNALSQKLTLIGLDPAALKANNIARQVAIRSPISGLVSKVAVNVGRYTAPTDVLFELIDLRDIHLVLHVFEKDLDKLTVGQRVLAYTNGNPAKKVEAKILLINRTLNQDRMAEVQCHFTAYDRALVPGTFMNGDVRIKTRQALTVPEEAVVRWENKAYVFTDQGRSIFRMVEVTPGLLERGRQQISGPGLSEQTALVVKNAYALLLKIKNTNAEG